ncbi:MAG: hypothetical protein IJH39_11355 [Clostridia bacterium]|nr:hypothetical protein [Clostridia bacterium]
MFIESELSYNNKRYGSGKAYVAKIIGKSSTYGFERKFLDRSKGFDHSSSTIWYSYEWKLEESGLYEKHEENSYQTRREYFIYDAEYETITKVSHSEALKYVQEFIIGVKQD